MLGERLSKYRELTGTDDEYTVIRSFVIDGHEVAWMEVNGTFEDERVDPGRGGSCYSWRSLYCECNFTEGVDFKLEEGRRIGLLGAEKCPYRKRVVALRHQELKEEYQRRFAVPSSGLIDHFEEIVFDLIEKVKTGEFLEDGNGASFWGGYFYLQTVAVIIGQPFPELWRLADKMVAEKKIDLDGAVIQPYREPPPPEWEESFRLEEDGWVGIAALPKHRKMPQVWKLTILNPDGEETVRKHVLLAHRPDFGPGGDDVAKAEEKLRELITSARDRG
jgi:hypothetical protein